MNNAVQAILAASPDARRRLRRQAGRRLPRHLPPDAVERQYRRELFAMLDAAWEAMQPDIERMAQPEKRQDAFDISGLAAALARGRRAFEEQAAPSASKLAAIAESVSKANARQWKRIVKSAIGIDLFSTDQALSGLVSEFSTENVQLITSIGDTFFSQIEELTQQGIRDGRRPESIAKEIEERFSVSKSRAKLIARDQVSKLNGQITKSRQTELGIEKYIWRTSQDERVRDSHKELDGQEFSWADPPSVGHPGSDYQCRCWAEPVIDIDTL